MAASKTWRPAMGDDLGLFVREQMQTDEGFRIFDATHGHLHP